MESVIAPLAACLPDLSRVPLRRQILIGVVASVLLHLLGFFALVGLSSIKPKTITFSQTPPKVKNLELEVVQLPAPKAPPEQFELAAMDAMSIDSDGLTKSDTAPENPLFESDQDMVAGSEIVGRGDVPLPTQAGAERSFTQFTTQRVLLGSGAKASLPSAEPAIPPPLFKPEPIRPEALPVEEMPEESESEPAPSPVFKTSSPVREGMPLLVAPPPDEIRIEAPAPNRRRPAEKVKKPKPQQMARLVPPSPKPPPEENPAESEVQKPPVPPAESAYQPELEKTRVEGSISNRGRPGVDSVKTPLGIYRKKLWAAIGSRWNFYVKQHEDIAGLGETQVSYSVTARGEIINVRVVSTTGNSTLSEIGAQSVREAEIPLPPPDVIELMKNGTLDEMCEFFRF